MDGNTMSSSLAQVRDCRHASAWTRQTKNIDISSLDSGWLQKAVRFAGEEGRVVEEFQLFLDAQFIDFLQFSSKTVKNIYILLKYLNKQAYF